MVIGSRIKELRVLKRMTQEEFATELRVNRSMVAKYEADSSMALATLLDVCQILDTHPDYLLGFSNSRNLQSDDGRLNLSSTLERDVIANLLEQIKAKDVEIMNLKRELTKART